jgi:molybdopterin-guanine dinucleotide biosynthesis protein A
VLSALRAVGGRASVAVPDGSQPPAGWEVLPGWDGTLDAVVRGLGRSEAELLAVIDAELPHPSVPVLRRLASSWRGEAAVLPLVDDRVRPLHAVYAVTALDGLERLRGDGARSLLHAVSALSGRVAGPELWGDLDPDGGFARKTPPGRTAGRPADHLGS